MDIQEVVKTVEFLMNSSTNDLTKLRALVWQYHSNSRVLDGNEPFPFSSTKSLSRSVYMEYIEYEFIDCSLVGGKERAKSIVHKWFS